MENNGLPARTVLKGNPSNLLKIRAARGKKFILTENGTERIRIHIRKERITDLLSNDE